MPRTTSTARAAAAIAIAAGSALTGGVGAGVASAEQEATLLPFIQTLRRCDFSDVKYVGSAGYARPTAYLRSDGADVVADIQIATASPNTRYEVRLIQLPQSSARGCNAGDPGVAGTVLFTDAAGAGAVSVSGPIMSGATGAWVLITRPSAHSQVPEEFYSTDTIARF